MKDVTITPARVREAWTAMQSGQAPWTDRQTNSGTARHYRQGNYTGTERHHFIGASGAEIQDRLENGFDPEGDLSANVQMQQAEGQSPAIDMHEENGMFLLSEALMGEDLIYAEWADQPAERGIKIRACFGVSAGTDSRTLAAYTEWILKVIDAVEAKGIAPSVELWIGAKNCFARGKDGMRITIPLVNAGEIIDPVAWRAYLAPGAFRSLGFVAMALAADDCKRSLSGGMGYPTNNGWDVRLDGDVLEIECPGMPSDFPAEAMDSKLAALEI